jgi:DNA-binding response OmpR family regulator
MTYNRILVIAPDTDLRHSLKFALEAEHFEVTGRVSIGAQLVPGDYDCAIVDHHGLGEDLAKAATFVAAFAPVILLANRSHSLSSSVFRTIVKPHLGSTVIDAVHDALSSIEDGAPAGPLVR